MKKIGVFGSKREMEQIIDTLYDLGVYHIEEAEQSELDIGDPLPQAEAIDEALVTAESLRANWGIEGETQRDIPTGDAIDKIGTIKDRNKELRQRLTELEQQQRHADAADDILSAMDDAGLDELPDLDSITVFTGTVSSVDRSLLDDVTTQYDYITHNDAIILMVASGHAEEMRDALRRLDFTPVDPAEVENVDDELEQVRRNLNELRENKRQAIIDCTAALRSASERAEAPLSFSVSDNTFYIEGYTPEHDADTLERELGDVTDGKIAVRELELDEAPIKFKNASPAQPFEFFMRLFNLPRYDEIDPTLITAITFPILFGFMLGDIGYGLVVLGIAMLGKRSYDFEFFDILAYSAVWTIIFGIGFGEIFGMEKLFGFHLPYLMHRMHGQYLVFGAEISSKILLFYLSIAFGILHLNLGLLVGFFNEYGRHGLTAALWEKGGWFVMEAAVALFALTYFEGLHYGYGLAIALLAAYIIYKGEGIQGVVEIPSLLSNTLSYARLMAIGLASAGLAIVVNDFAGQLATGTVTGYIAASLIFIIGHSINVCLGILGPTLHSLRLHYVEFFTKFFEGGGKPFKAFGGR